MNADRMANLPGRHSARMESIQAPSDVRPWSWSETVWAAGHALPVG
jgi:hypothetical protein